MLENLRQPLEDGVIHISRAAGNLTFPAKFILVAAMNPCPCGFAGDREKRCICSPGQIANYRKKISGPILDRIDLHVNVPRIKFDKLNDEKPATSSAEIKKKVEAARARQRARFKNTPFLTNAEMTTEAVKQFCPIDNDSKQLLRNAVDKMGLSARGYFRVLKLARTIADLAGQENIAYLNVSEALQYRPTDN